MDLTWFSMVHSQTRGWNMFVFCFTKCARWLLSCWLCLWSPYTIRVGHGRSSSCCPKLTHFWPFDVRKMSGLVVWSGKQLAVNSPPCEQINTNMGMKKLSTNFSNTCLANLGGWCTFCTELHGQQFRILDTLFTRRCFFLPGPPNFGFSRQNLHSPQPQIQPSQEPQPLPLSFCTFM